MSNLDSLFAPADASEDSAPDSGNIFDVLVPPQQQAKNAAITNIGASPDQATKQIKAAPSLGLPPQAVDPVTGPLAARQARAAAVIDENPHIATYVNADPMHPKVSADDYDKLNAFSKSLYAITSGYTQGKLEEQRGTLGFSHIIGTDVSRDLADIDAQIAQNKQPDMGPFYRVLSGAAGLVGGLSEHKAEIAGGTVVGALAGPIGAGTGFAAGLSAGFGRTAAGRNFLDTEGMRDANGNPLPLGARLGAATIVGAINAGAGMLGTNAAGTALEPLVNSAAREALANPTIVGALTKGATEVAKGSATGAGIMGAITLGTEATNDAAKSLTGGQWATIFNDPARQAEVAKAVNEAMGEGALLLGAMHLPAAGQFALLDGLRARQARVDAAGLDNAAAAADATATKGRVPDALRSLVEGQTQNQSIGVPIEAVDKLLAADPRAMDFDPGIAGQLETARSTGGDVDVGLGRLLANAPKETVAALRDDVRMRPDGMTVREADELEAREPTYGHSIDEPTTVDGRDPGSVSNAIVDGAKSARTANWLDPLFRPDEQNEVPLGMTEQRYARYSAALERQAGETEAKAQRLAEAEVARRLKPEWADREAAMRQEVEYSTLRRPDIMADRYLRDGSLSDGQVPAEARVKLDSDVVNALLGSDDQLPRGFTAKKGGVHPDELADLFGYNSGQKMLQDLMALNRTRQRDGLTPGQHIQRTIRDETDRRMEERYGLLDEHIQREADDMVVTQSQLAVLGHELEALNPQSEMPIDRAGLEARIHSYIGQMPVKKAADYDGMMRNIARLGQKTEDYLQAGNTKAAFLTKQQQYQQFVMAQDAKVLRGELRQFDRQMTRFKEQAVTGVKQEYTDQVHRIMDQLDFAHKRNADELLGALEGKGTLADFVTSKGELRSIPVADFLSDGTAPKFQDMTTKQARAAMDSLKTLEFNGRGEEKLRLAGKREDLFQQTEKAIETMSTLKQKVQKRDLNILDKAKVAVRQGDVGLLKTDQMFQWLDKNDPTGVFSKIYDGFAEAKYETARLYRESYENLKPTRENDIGPRQNLENTALRDWNTGELLQLDREGLRGLMVHLGNESNEAKLTARFDWKGQTHGFDVNDVWNFVRQHATEGDWKAVQGVWDTYEHLWPEIVAKERARSGLAPTKVPAREVSTEWGKFRGGYVPVDRDYRYPFRSGYDLDSIRDSMAEKGRTPEQIERAIKDIRDRNQEAIDASPFAETRRRSSVPKRDYEKERTGANYPVDYSMSRTVKAISETIHDIAYRDPLIEGKKFLDQGRIKEGIQSAFGKEYADSVQPWLEHIAKSKQVDDIGLQLLNRGLRMVRHNLVMTELVGRLSTLVKHTIAAASNSAGEVGGINLMRELYGIYGDFAVNPKGVFDRIKAMQEESGELRTRMHSWDRDIAALSDPLGTGKTWHSVYLGGKKISFAPTQRAAAYVLSQPISLLDQMSALPVYSATKRAMLERGLSEEDAIAAANRAVRNAHGASGPADMSPIMRSNNEAIKAMTVAFSFFNHSYNRLRNVGRLAGEAISDAKAGEAGAAMGKVLKAGNLSLYYVVLLGLAEHWVTHGGQKEDESLPDYAMEGVRDQVAAQFPLGRTLYARYKYGRFTSETPIGSYANAIGLAGNELLKIKRGEDVSPNFVSRMIRGSSYAFGIPGGGQLATSRKYIEDVDNGNQEADNLYRVTRGLVMGKSHPEEEGTRSHHAAPAILAALPSPATVYKPKRSHHAKKGP